MQQIKLFSCGTLQASGQGVSENSTQMYYAKLTLDKNALGNLTEILKPFVTNTTLHVDHLNKTTSKHFF